MLSSESSSSFSQFTRVLPNSGPTVVVLVFSAHMSFSSLTTTTGTRLLFHWAACPLNTQMSDTEVVCNCPSVLTMAHLVYFLSCVLFQPECHCDEHISTMKPCHSNQRDLSLACFIMWSRDHGTYPTQKQGRNQGPKVGPLISRCSLRNPQAHPPNTPPKRTPKTHPPKI